MLTGQCDGSEAALLQRGVQAAHALARGTEYHGRFRFMEAQQVHHRMLDFRRGNRHGLIGDIAMAAIFADGRNAQRIILIALGERDDRLGHGRREQQRAALIGRGVEDLFQIIAETHIEHLVRFIQHRCTQRGQIKRIAFQMIAQTARCAYHDVGALTQSAALLAGVHPANAGRDDRAGLLIQPCQFAADLQGQFAGRRDHQGQGSGGDRNAILVAKQFGRHGETKGNGLAGSGLRRNDQIALGSVAFEDGGLDGGRLVIATGGKRIAKERRQFGKGHISRLSLADRSAGLGNGDPRHYGNTPIGHRAETIIFMHRWRGMVRPEGFEPPAPRFVVWCSIQLSYGRLEGLAIRQVRPVLQG